MQRKPMGKHINSIAIEIENLIDTDTAKKGEEYYLNLFSQLVEESDGLRGIWRLLDDYFDKPFFTKLLLMSSDQRRSFEARAQDELLKGNSTARSILMQLAQPIKLARKSFQGM